MRPQQGHAIERHFSIADLDDDGRINVEVQPARLLRTHASRC
jgi:hypothetical protein